MVYSDVFFPPLGNLYIIKKLQKLEECFAAWGFTIQKVRI